MADLDDVHRRLRSILDPFRVELAVTRDGPEGMALEVPGLEGEPWGYVAGTRLGKRYVSFYLMPVYVSGALDETISAEARRSIPGFRAEAERIAVERKPGGSAPRRRTTME